MNVLTTLLILINMKIIEAKLVDNLLLLSHASGPSHLLVMFDLAERFNDSENVHDVRFPILQCIQNFKSRENFKRYNYGFSMKKADEMQRYLNEFTLENPMDILTLLKMVGSGMESLIVPCNLTENIFDFAACYTVISRKHEARIVYVAPGVESSTISSFSGAPLPGYAMSDFKADPELKFSTRLMDFFVHGLFKYYFLQIPLAKWWYNGDDRNYQNLKESIVVVNFHKFIASPLPRTHLIVEMGNLLEKEIQIFDSKVQHFIDSYESIVYFSMSTYTSDRQLPAQIVHEFTTAFKRFPTIGFIWRFKEDLVVSPPNNILFIDWIEQRSLLAHPKTKLLITHCGMNSVLEAAHAGIPMIGTPTIGDQYPNSEAIKRLKTGIILDLYSFNNTQLSDAIHQILRPNSIELKSAKRLKDMLSFERESNIALDGTFRLKRFMRMRQEDFEKFWVPKNINWISHFYFDLTLFLLLLTWVCSL